jgi:hypothetical protein
MTPPAKTPDRRPGPGRPQKTRMVPIADIILLPKTMRPRVAESADQVSRYKTDMENGDAFPPISLYKGPAGELAGLGLTPSGALADIEKDDVLVLSDGYHRLAAVRALQRPQILATVESGSWRDAQWAALGCNHAHGLHVTNADKRKIVGLILDDTEWSRRSARAIAQHCHVSPNLVDTLKRERTARTPTTATKGQSTTVVDKRGRTIKTGKIGTTKKPPPPRAPLAEDSRGKRARGIETIDLERLQTAGTEDSSAQADPTKQWAELSQRLEAYLTATVSQGLEDKRRIFLDTLPTKPVRQWLAQLDGLFSTWDFEFRDIIARYLHRQSLSLGGRGNDYCEGTRLRSTPSTPTSDAWMQDFTTRLQEARKQLGGVAWTKFLSDALDLLDRTNRGKA